MSKCIDASTGGASSKKSGADRAERKPNKKPPASYYLTGDQAQIGVTQLDMIIVSGKQGNAKGRKPIRFVDGWSEGAWASLAVKSLRIGWPEGIRQAASRLSPSTMKSLLVCGLFEDTFPAPSELQDCLGEIATKDYDALCQRATHHSRGYTQQFFDLEDEAVSAAQTQKPYLWSKGKEYGLWLPPRSLNCFYTFLRLQPMDAGVQRPLDLSPWVGMPEAMVDGHTPEGRKAGVKDTLLSGSYSQHLALSQRVERDAGWDGIRAEVHSRTLIAEPVLMPTQTAFQWKGERTAR
jgi:hypothetical protein